MIAYASTTGTLRNLVGLREAGWRLLAGPFDTATHGFAYALDNGAWSAYQQERAFDETAFARVYRSHGEGADWIVLPDIVAAGLDSLLFSLEWLDRLNDYQGLFLLAVQDGMKPEHVRPFIGKRVGLFVGGTTPWKLDTLPQWAELARTQGVYLHVGRVNTARRIRYCSGFGVHSFDGTSASRYSETLPLLDFARRQQSLDFNLIRRRAP